MINGFGKTIFTISALYRTLGMVFFFRPKRIKVEASVLEHFPHFGFLKPLTVLEINKIFLKIIFHFQTNNS